MSRKKQPFTLSMAVGSNTFPLNLQAPGGAVLEFLIPERPDVVRERMQNKLQDARTDQELHRLMADWLLPCAKTQAAMTREDILAVLGDEQTAPEQVSLLLTIILTGKAPDPKLHGQLIQKLANRMLEQLIEQL